MDFKYLPPLIVTNQHRSVNTFSRFVALGQVPLTGSSFHVSAKDRLGQHGRKVWLVGRAIHSNTVNRVCLKFGLILSPFLSKQKIKKLAPNFGHAPPGETCGDLCCGDGRHLCLLRLRHRQDEQPEVWVFAKAIVSRRSSPINLTKRSYDIVVNVQTKSKQTKHDNVVNVYKQ